MLMSTTTQVRKYTTCKKKSLESIAIKIKETVMAPFKKKKKETVMAN